jgi:hypothetical protein
MLIKFLTGSYRSLVGIAAWGVLLIGVAIGAIIGVVINAHFMDGSVGYLPIITALIGLILSFVIEVVVIPPFMILFTIDARVKYIESKLKDNDTSST